MHEKVVEIGNDDLLTVINEDGSILRQLMVNSKGQLIDATYSVIAGGFIDADEFRMTRGADGWVSVKGKILC